MLSLSTFADQLMERVIYRSTYKQLYLFQKTLRETNQFVMAATVPVKIEKRNAASPTETVEEYNNTPDTRLLTYQRCP